MDIDNVIDSHLHDEGTRDVQAARWADEARMAWHWNLTDFERERYLDAVMSDDDGATELVKALAGQFHPVIEDALDAIRNKAIAAYTADYIERQRAGQ